MNVVILFSTSNLFRSFHFKTMETEITLPMKVSGLRLKYTLLCVHVMGVSVMESAGTRGDPIN